MMSDSAKSDGGAGRQDAQRNLLFRRIFRNTSLLMTGKGMNALFSLGYTALAVRALGIEGFGLLVLVHTYTQVIGEFTKFQSWQAVLRYGTPALGNGRKRDLQRLLIFTASLDVAGGVVGSVIAFAGAALVGPLLGWPVELIPAAALYGLSVFFTSPSTAGGLLRLWDRFDLLAARSVLGSLIRLVGSVVLLIGGGDLTAFLGVWFAATAISGLALTVGGWREAARHGALDGIKLSFSSLASGLPGIWRLLWTTHLNATLMVTTTHIGTLLMGGLLGAAQAGLYRIARQIAELGVQPGKLFTAAIYPELSRLVANKAFAVMRSLVIRSAVYAGIGALLFFFTIWLVGEPLLTAYAGKDAAAAFDVMVLLTAGSLILVVAFPLEPTLISVGLETAALRSRLSAAVVYLPLLFLLIRWQGLVGAGIAFIIGHLVAAALQANSVYGWFGSRRAEVEAAARCLARPEATGSAKVP